MLVGIHQSRSVNLTEVARSLKEEIDLHASHKRLSRNLARSELIGIVGDRLLAMGAAQVTNNTLLIVHCYNLVKRFAAKMEYLCDDESEGAGLSSYQVCEVVAFDTLYPDRYVPLTMHLWSRRDPNYESDEFEVRSTIQRVEQATEGRGTFYLRPKRDMPTTSEAEDQLLQFLLRESDTALVTSVIEEGQFIADGQLRSATDLIETTELPFGKMMFKYVPPGYLDEKLAMELAMFVQFGTRCITLTEIKVPVTLVVTEYKQQESSVLREHGATRMAFLVNGHITDRDAVWPLIRDFHRVVDVIDVEQNHRADFKLSNFRVLTYDRLRLLTTFLEAVMYYETFITGQVRIDIPRITQDPHKGNHIRDFLLPPDTELAESA